MIRELPRFPDIYRFFRWGIADPGDVDAIINTNVLWYLGRRRETEPVIEYLLKLIGEGRETISDRWYVDPFVCWYFLTRALAGTVTRAGELILMRLENAGGPHALKAAVVPRTET